MFIQSIFNSTLPNFIHSSISLIISALRPPKCLILSTSSHLDMDIGTKVLKALKNP